jgi:cell division protein FtsQ
MNSMTIKRISIVASLVILLEAVLLSIPFIKRHIQSQINRVEQRGDHQFLAKSTFDQIAKQFIGKGFLTLDLDQVKSAFEASPWIKNANVRRLWPDTLMVKVKEKTPVAYWNNKGLLDLSGKPFYPNDNRTNLPLPRLLGVDTQSVKIYTQYLAYQQYFNSKGIEIVGMEQTEQGEWRLSTIEGIDILLGQRPNLEQLKRVALLLESLSSDERHHMSYMDARYTNGVAVKWQETKNSKKQTG